jgi:4Fe-4S ferredoxin
MKFKKVHISTHCIGCGVCESVCPVNNLISDKEEFNPDKAKLAINVINGVAAVHEETCMTCGTCTFNCPVGAITSEYDAKAS